MSESESAISQSMLQFLAKPYNSPTGLMIFGDQTFEDWAKSNDSNGDGLSFKELYSNLPSIYDNWTDKIE